MDAGRELLRAYSERADGVAPGGRPLVGLFGEGIPAPVIEAAGALAVDVKAPPLADALSGPQDPQVAAIAEPFLDDFSTRFLHRLAAGAFDRFALLVFARDDVAGLAAYQYAAELRRQGMVPAGGPRLHLWNMLHTDTPAAHRFNLAELDRLTDALAALGLDAAPPALDRALHETELRRAALCRWSAARARDVRHRIAGRWLPPARHAALLDALATETTGAGGPRIGMVGTACDTDVLHRACADLGQVAVDAQPFGDTWPPDLSPCRDAGGLVHVLATDPLHIRANPAGRFGTALLDRLADCDLVVASVDRNDDSLGWDLPRVRSVTLARGARFLDLGFRPFRPDAAWCADARNRIAEALA